MTINSVTTQSHVRIVTKARYSLLVAEQFADDLVWAAMGMLMMTVVGLLTHALMLNTVSVGAELMNNNCTSA
jgi:hypothetical protein